MPPLNPRETGSAYWKSLDHVADTPEFREFLHREFPAGASELLGEDRRQFLKVMGASMALAGLGLAGCRRWPAEEIVPHAHRAPGRDPGTPVYYATSMELAGVASPLLAKAYDGRPIKLEGNPDHPASHGAASVFAQASVLDLYDPDRSRQVWHDGAASSWDDFAAWAAGVGTDGLVVLSEATSSPTVAELRRALEAQGVAWHEYEPVNNDDALAASTAAFGGAFRPQLHLDAAHVVLSLDADILEGHANALHHVRGFADGRRAVDGGTMNRLYSVESDLSLTGANADERAGLRPADMVAAAAYIGARLLNDAEMQRFEEAGDLPAAVKAVLDHAIEDLQAAGSHGLMVAGDHLPAAAQQIAHLVNGALNAVGTTVSYTAWDGATSHVSSLASLISKLNAGSVKTLLILGGNPVYDAPADLDFAAAMAKATTSVHLSDYRDETSTLATWHLNRAHYLETWGDARSWDGTYTLTQPLIEPLWSGRSPIEVLALFSGSAATAGDALVRATFDAQPGAGGDGVWRQALHDGYLAGSAARADRPRAGRSGLSALLSAARDAWSGARSGWDVRFTPCRTVYDGRFANNGWLQELPDTMTKITWDNAVVINPDEAEALGVREGDMVRLAVDGRAVTAAVFRLPGVPAKTAVVSLGYGRSITGPGSGNVPVRIATDAGFDFGAVRSSTAMSIAAGGEVTRADGAYPLATTQDHHTIDVDTVGGKGVQTRLPQLFREADANAYHEHPDFAKHAAHVAHRLSLWEETNLDGEQYRWALSVDLNSCVGCNACVIACQAENNIPIVGKDQVMRGRELHWMRVDRYFKFKSTADHGWDGSQIDSVALQPVMCMMCENAPCEQVCPVAATTHDKDGLNVMVYNRCIGTRYCSNNCPYKVRRFNYFDYHKRDPLRETGMLQVNPDYYTSKTATPEELRQLQFNPEVTVRMRGVMEKCTYCTQRIMDARISAKNEFAQLPEDQKAPHSGNGRVPIEDGTITPACAQTCAANAIVFGDLLDPNSRISKLHKADRSYEMLEELNVKARTKYMAKVRNPFGGGSAENPYGHHGHGGGHGHDHDHGDHDHDHDHGDHDHDHDHGADHDH